MARRIGSGSEGHAATIFARSEPRVFGNGSHFGSRDSRTPVFPAFPDLVRPLPGGLNMCTGRQWSEILGNISVFASGLPSISCPFRR